MKLPLVIALAALTGCAGSPIRIAMMSDEEIKTVGSAQLCHAYRNNGSERTRGELMRRGDIPASEWALIDKREISVGMSELGLICSWGGADVVNNRTSANGTLKQWVYGGYSRYSKRNYVYTMNGFVTSWSN